MARMARLGSLATGTAGNMVGAGLRQAGMALGFDPEYWHTPPADTLFLHRKIGGLYLLAARLQARVDLRTLFQAHHPAGKALIP